MSLTGAQRYKQARVKSRILNDRLFREFLEGKRDSLPCSMDQERDFIVADLEQLRLKVDRQEAFIKELSDALLKVRPLGGSEMFVKRFGRHYADPAYCGLQIEVLHSRLHEMLKELAAARKTMRSVLSEVRQPEGER